MAWNITKTEEYQQRYQEEYSRKMRGVRLRTEELHRVFALDDETLVSDFSAIAPFFIDGKMFDLLDKKLNRLLLDGRFEAHKSCLSSLAEVVFSEQGKVVPFLTWSTRRYSKDIIFNPLINDKDSFELLTMTLMMYPEWMNQHSGILKDVWLKGISDPQHSDMMFAAFSIFAYRAYRFYDSAPYDEKINESASLELLYSNMAKSCAKESSYDLIDMIPQPDNISSNIKKYVRQMNHLVSPAIAYSAVTHPTAMAWNIESFFLGLKYRLPELPKYAKDLDYMGFDYYNRIYLEIARSPMSTDKTLRAAFLEDKINQENIDILVERDKMRDIIRYMPKDRQDRLLAKELDIPFVDGTKAFKLKQFSSDLGI